MLNPLFVRGHLLRSVKSVMLELTHSFNNFLFELPRIEFRSNISFVRLFVLFNSDSIQWSSPFMPLSVTSIALIAPPKRWKKSLYVCKLYLESLIVRYLCVYRSFNTTFAMFSNLLLVSTKLNKSLSPTTTKICSRTFRGKYSKLSFFGNRLLMVWISLFGVASSLMRFLLRPDILIKCSWFILNLIIRRHRKWID